MAVRVFRCRGDDPKADHAVSERLLETTAEGDWGVRVWFPHRQVVFGRRDGLAQAYGRAKAIARERGFPPTERGVGGRAVAYDGETTLAFARSEPVDDLRQGIDERYDRLLSDVERALERIGVDVIRDEPPDSFCPGSHSVSIARSEAVGTDGTELRKISGLAQRVTQTGALVSGILVVDNRTQLGAVLADVYRALSVPFDPSSLGAVAESAPDVDPITVRETLESELIGSRRIAETIDDGR